MTIEIADAQIGWHDLDTLAETETPNDDGVDLKPKTR